MTERLNKRQHAKGLTRQKVLDAARKLWATPGSYERGTIRAIAKEAGMAPAAIRKFDELTQPATDRRTLYGLTTRYLAALEENQNLAPRTKADRRKHLDIARAGLGDMEIRALESRKARLFLLAWRDKRAATQRQPTICWATCPAS